MPHARDLQPCPQLGERAVECGDRKIALEQRPQLLLPYRTFLLDDLEGVGGERREFVALARPFLFLGAYQRVEVREQRSRDQQVRLPEQVRFEGRLLAQQAQHELIDQGEDGGVGANPQRQRGHGHEAEQGAACQVAKRKTDVGNKTHESSRG